MLSAFVGKYQKDFDDLIPLLMLAYRSSSYEATGRNRNEMILGALSLSL